MAEPTPDVQILVQLTPQERADVNAAKYLLRMAESQTRINQFALTKMWDVLRQRYQLPEQFGYDEPSGAVFLRIISSEQVEEPAQPDASPESEPQVGAKDPTILSGSPTPAPNRAERRRRQRR